MIAHAEGVDLHFERAGEGPAAVLLIMGLGMNATGWWRTVPVLAERFTVLAFDNRGVGRSGRPEGPYTLTQMAADGVAVLDAAGVEKAHVYGISLGGMIAQELALQWPQRVRGLVLAATTPGGSSAVAPDPDTLAFFHRRGQMPAEEGVWASVPYNYSPRTRAEGGQRISEDVERRLRFPVEQKPYVAQLSAAIAHDTYERLAEISAPTLVVHGAQDCMVHPDNARLIADRIPGARLELFEHAGHMLFTDEPGVDLAVSDFLRDVDAMT